MMDIDLARTFIDIVRTGSFIATAERLHITQTTVTARVHNLEAQLGCRLFVRNRAGARLTEQGERFMRYASQLVQTWDAARPAFAGRLRRPDRDRRRSKPGHADDAQVGDAAEAGSVVPCDTG